DVVEKPPFIMRHGDQRKVIHINFNSAAVDDVYFPQSEVVGDIADTVTRRADKAGRPPTRDFSYFRRITEYVKAHMSEMADDPRFPIIPQRIVSDVQKVMPQDGIVTLDNGIYKIWFARNYKAAKPNTLLLDNALATMGAGLPS